MTQQAKKSCLIFDEVRVSAERGRIAARAVRWPGLRRMLFWIALRPSLLAWHGCLALLMPGSQRQRRAGCPAAIQSNIAGSLRTVIATTVPLFLAITLIGSTGDVRAQQNLPNMGEPADTTLSPAQELQLGQQFMRQVRASLPLSQDVELTEFTTSLGQRIVNAAARSQGQPRQPFEFFLVNSKIINAFAIPGGFIGLNVGLVQAMDTEAQLAGVVAHEISHITQRHHARAFASDGRNRMTAAVAILAAIIIGQANPQAGQAALAAGIAATQQNLINFTRQNEYEADRSGIELLSRANFPPQAMAEAFDILRRRNRVNSSGSQLEYLRTHPLDNNRIAEARSRAANLAARAKPVSPDQQASLRYELFKARLRVLSQSDDARLLQQLKAEHKQQPAAGIRYAISLVQLRQRNLSAAAKWLAPLVEAHPGQVNLQMQAARIAYARGAVDISEQILRPLISLYPESYAAVEELSNQLATERQLSDAYAVLSDYLRSASSINPRAWRALANVNQKLGYTAASHEAMARYYRLLHEPQRAEQQLRLALQAADAGSQDQLRLEAQIRELQQQLSKR